MADIVKVASLWTSWIGPRLVDRATPSMGTLVCRPGNPPHRPDALVSNQRTHSCPTLSARARPAPANTSYLVRPPDRSGVRRRVLTVLAALVFAAALLDLGLDGLIPFGLLVAFGLGSGSVDARRSVVLSRRNFAVSAVMVAAFAWFWLWHLQLTESTLLLTAGSLIALPLTLQESDESGASSAPSRSPDATSSWPSGRWWSSSTSTTRTGRASTC